MVTTGGDYSFANIKDTVVKGTGFIINGHMKSIHRTANLRKDGWLNTACGGIDFKL